MKKLVVIALALMQVGTVVARPLKEELELLTVQLHNLGEKFGLETPPPPPPHSPSPDRPLTREELEQEKELAERPAPPPPAELLPPAPQVKAGEKVPQPPKGLLPAELLLPIPVAKPGRTVVLSPPALVPGDVRPQPQPHSDSEDEQENTGQTNIPKPPPPPGSGTVKPKEQEPTEYVFSSPSIRMPQFNVSSSDEVILIPNKLTMRAYIGILDNGNLVVWGPQLKEEPIATRFIYNEKFTYPSLEAIDYKVVGGKVVYAMYTLINIDELKTQKQDINANLRDKLSEQISLMSKAVQDGDLNTLLDSIQNRLPQVIENSLTILKRELLQVEKIYPQSFNENVLSIEQIEQMINDLEDAVKSVITKIVQEFGNLIRTKRGVFEVYVGNQNNPNLKLLAQRWERDKSYAETRRKLNQITALSLPLNTQFNQIEDWAHLSDTEIKQLMEMLKNALETTARADAFSKPISSAEESIKAKLQNQKQNKARNELGEFYKNLQSTLKEGLAKQEKDAQAEQAKKAFEANALAGAERIRRLAEQRAKEQEPKEQEEPSDEWDD